MSELILLCSAAALDRLPDQPSGAAIARAATLAREDLRPGRLQKLLARGRIARDTHDAALLPTELPEHAWLRRRFGLHDDDSVDAFAAHRHGLELPVWRLTPSHVTIGLDHAMLVDPGQLRLRDDESLALGQAAAELFREYGFTLHASSPSEWFLTGETSLALRGRGWRMAAGRNVDAYLPTGPDARLWRKMVSEVQMIWFRHPINEAREARAEPAVNMLWLDGRAHQNPAPQAIVALSSSSEIGGLVLAAGGELIPQQTLPDASQLASLEAAASQCDVLIDLSTWSESRRTDDARAWLDAWQGFEQWISTLLIAGWQPGRSRTLRLVLTGERRTLEISLGGHQRWQFWRRLDLAGLVF